MTANSVLSVVKSSEQALKLRTFKHFSEFPSTFFVVVGKASGRREDVIKSVCGDLNIPEHPRVIRCFAETENAETIVSEAAIPDCIGIVAFGMSSKRAEVLQELLVKAKISGDYAVFDDENKLIKRSALVGHLRNLLQLSFASGPE